MTEQGRRILIFGLLALTVAAALWPLPNEIDAGRGKPTSAAKARVGKAGGTPLPRKAEGMPDSVANGSQTGEAAEIVDLFPAQSWAPKVVVPDKPAAPEPPTISFVFAGRYQEEGQSMIFLTEGDGMYAVREGDPLPGGWKLTEIGPTALKLFYAPLNVTRTLPISELRP